MKKRLFVLAGLALVVLAIGVTTLLTKSPKSTSCESFIAGIEKNDGAGTYAKFTDRVKGLIDAKTWADQVKTLSAVYSNQKPTPISGSVPINDPATNKVTGYTDDYIVQYGTNKYKATCTTTVSEPGKIDSFSSKVTF